MNPSPSIDCLHLFLSLFYFSNTYFDILMQKALKGLGAKFETLRSKFAIF